MRNAVIAAALLAAVTAVDAHSRREVTMMKRLTPVLYVEEIEPALPFWEERLGFKRTTEVPHGDDLGFVILEKDGIEIMYQTRPSVAADIPAVAEALPTGAAFLFIEVDDVDTVDDALREYERVIPRRTTSYGADEIVVREPGGNIVIFAQFGD